MPPLPGVDLSETPQRAEGRATDIRWSSPTAASAGGVLFITDDEITAPPFPPSNGRPSQKHSEKEFDVYQEGGRLGDHRAKAARGRSS